PRDDLGPRDVRRVLLAALARAAALLRDGAASSATTQVERSLSPRPQHYRQICTANRTRGQAPPTARGGAALIDRCVKSGKRDEACRASRGTSNARSRSQPERAASARAPAVAR